MADSNSTKRGHNFKDLTGQTFGKWTVLEFHSRSKQGKSVWLCRCKCGAEKPVQASSLQRGKSRSCKSCARTKHGKAGLPEYYAWREMLRRCHNPHCDNYANYGGRGITVCERWLTLEQFLEDMGTRPSSEHSIERRDNDGNYEPSNCYWATPKEQARNRRNNRMLTYNGRTLCVAEWAEELGIVPNRIHNRLQLGWSDEKIITVAIASAHNRDG